MLNKNFDYLTKQQKSALCHSVKSFVKKNFGNDELMAKFLEDERYYIKVEASRLYFIKEYLDNERFLKELRFYFDECLKYYEYQLEQIPLENASKLDLRNVIREIKNEYQTD